MVSLFSGKGIKGKRQRVRVAEFEKSWNVAADMWREEGVESRVGKTDAEGGRGGYCEREGTYAGGEAVGSCFQYQ